MYGGPPSEPTRFQEDQREREDAADYYYESRIEDEAEEAVTYTGAFYECGKALPVPEGETPPDRCPVCGARRLE